MVKKPGFSGIGFVCFVFVFFIVTFITMEYYHIFTVKESVETDVSRALNVAVEFAMLDLDRTTHESVMNTDIAEQEFEKYLKEDMGLNRSYEKYDTEGDFQYQIIIDSENIQRSPAKYTISGKIKMQPVTVRNILPSRFDIPFSASSRNTRMDD